jgi:hypothetical protein
MMKFSKRLEVGEDTNMRLSVIGFEHNGMLIHEPFRSSCGRFSANPESDYGISEIEAIWLDRLNLRLEHASEAAMNAGILEIQQAIGVTVEDDYKHDLSQHDLRNRISKALAKYVLEELANATS